MPAQPRAVIWVVTQVATHFEARLFLVEKTGLDSTDVVLRADSRPTLFSMAPRGFRRIGKLPTQAATVLENWI
jgi:hypothetical protein